MAPCALQGKKPPKVKKTFTDDERREPLRELLREALPDQDASTSEEVASLSGTQLRDRLIAHQPLDTEWIKRINQVSTAGELYYSDRVCCMAVKHPW